MLAPSKQFDRSKAALEYYSREIIGVRTLSLSVTVAVRLERRRTLPATAILRLFSIAPIQSENAVAARNLSPRSEFVAKNAQSPGCIIDECKLPLEVTRSR